MLHRRLSPNARLYTEMVHANAIVRGDRDRLLGYSPEEHPLALQLGGSDPVALADAAAIAVAYGYDEINLNCGCPSERVQEGAFGACLMREPDRVAAAISAMRAAVPASVPVTVKCRIGVDDQDDYTGLERFVTTVADAGCSLFVVHARKAWLKGLSPKENREVPPLDYARVARLKAEHPHLTIVLNGGVVDLDGAFAAISRFDGVMIGRAAYHTPWLLADIEQRVFGTFLPDRLDVLRGLQPYVESQLAAGTQLATIVRHWLGLPHGLTGARAFRRVLTEDARASGAGWNVVEKAMDALSGPVAQAA